ncbi:hypothetical protein ACP70R_007866 [Stipagrostis hirtigluma subsp. patula]
MLLGHNGGRGANRGGHGRSRDDYGRGNGRGTVQQSAAIGFAEDFVPDERKVAAAIEASASYNVDNNWYTDSGSTNHNADEWDKLVRWEKYNGNYQMHAANCSV